jgi:signal transduction histidine kinase
MLDLPTRNEPLDATTFVDAGSSRKSRTRDRSRIGGLTGRILIVTVSAVIVSMAVAFTSRLEVARENWLSVKIETVRAALDAFDRDEAPLPPELANKVLSALGMESIVALGPDGRREIASSSPPPPEATVDLSHGGAGLRCSLLQLYRTLLARGSTTVLVKTVDPPLELVFDQKPMSERLRQIAGALLGIMIAIAVLITLVVWLTVWRLVLQPVHKLTTNIVAFGERPQDVSRIIQPSGSHDEIGRAEEALAAMQQSLAHELAQRKRMAELGMAVARINHDLRNILSAAQLISDRLATIPDPQAQRLAPRLVATLDRAIQFCQATLTYGAGSEQPPARRVFDLNRMAEEVVEAARAEHGEAIHYAVDIPPRFEIFADPDHILRVIENLNRNASQALMAKGSADGDPKAIRFAAIRTDGTALIEISDTGPGFPPEQRDRIFEAFHTSTSVLGTGLGLSIAADLVTRNGGSIELAPSKAEDFYCGARFLINLPTPERGA